MLGDKSKMPELTKLVFDWYNFWNILPGIPGLTILAGIGMTGLILVMRLREMQKATTAFLVCAALLLGHYIVCESASRQPILELLHSLSGA